RCGTHGSEDDEARTTMTGSPGSTAGRQTAADDAIPPFRYTAELANEIELRWQDFWEQHGTFEAPNPTGPLAPPDGNVPADKSYILDMFPYPSGAGLHVGHPLGYIGTDVLGRFQRMTGRNVLHTIGYDAFRSEERRVGKECGRRRRAAQRNVRK